MMLDNQTIDKAVLEQISAKLEGRPKLISYKIAKQSLNVISNQTCQELAKISAVDSDQDHGDNLIGFSNQSDLTPGVYEGGFKVWECTRDMINYIHSDLSLTSDQANVLDLGCGSGLVGITILKLTSWSVDFQDFNPNVLKYFTLPNILINMKSQEDQSLLDCLEKNCAKRCQLISGDWSTLREKVSRDRLYEYIFSCETIYNQENYSKLVDVLANCLAPKGKAYFGAKSYYFGVGGGTQEFQEFVNNGSQLVCEEVKVIPDCLERSILQISHKKTE